MARYQLFLPSPVSILHGNIKWRQSRLTCVCVCLCCVCAYNLRNVCVDRNVSVFSVNQRSRFKHTNIHGLHLEILLCALSWLCVWPGLYANHNYYSCTHTFMGSMCLCVYACWEAVYLYDEQ